MSVLSVFLLALSLPNASSAKVVSVVADLDEIPFILDDKGYVWSQKLGPSLDGRGDYFKLPGLSEIVAIVPYGALRRDGKVLTWHTLPDRPQKCRRPKGCEANSVFDRDFTEPKIVEGINNVVKIEGGGAFHYFLVLLADGRLAEWREKQDHRQPKYQFPEIVPHIIPGISSVKSISVHYSSSVALSHSGYIYGWGERNIYGQLGLPKSEELVSSDHPLSLYAGDHFKKVATSGNHTMAVTNDGHVVYWGGCSFDGSDHPEHDVSGYVDDIDEVEDVIPSISSDSEQPNIFIRKDGSVWWVYGPNPSSTPCSLTNHPSERATRAPGRFPDIELPEQ